MAFVQIEPQSKYSENLLLGADKVVREIIRTSIADVWNVPANDIIINIQRCVVASPDPTAVALGAIPDVVIKINTSGGSNFIRTLVMKFHAKRLADRIETQWRKEVGDCLQSEIWIRFFHTWGITFDL